MRDALKGTPNRQSLTVEERGGEKKDIRDQRGKRFVTAGMKKPFGCCLFQCAFEV